MQISSEKVDMVQFIRFCNDTANYTADGAYQISLNQLFANLTTNAPRTGFYTATAGHGADRVYGLLLCRGDVPSDICSNCVYNSVSQAFSGCSGRRSAVVWMEECFIRYSDVNFIGTASTGVNFSMPRPTTNSDPALFNRQLSRLMANLSSMVTGGLSRFAVDDVPFQGSQRIYGMAQCTRDITRSDCASCLEDVVREMPICCSGRSEGIVYTVNCGARYGPFSFTFQSGVVGSPSGNQTPDGSSADSNQISPDSNGSRKRIVIIVSIMVPLALLLLGAVFHLLLLKRKTTACNRTQGDEEIGDMESLVFSLESMRAATNNFSEANKLGEGGFGPVYKGILPGGKEVAVKRLGRSSDQGTTEFQNEVRLVAKLQHRNLVRLLGCCLDGSEQLLIYEFVPNQSLDKLLFDPLKRAQLDWTTRVKIMCGIARGLLYLHEDSRLRIIHRDLKAANILLDVEMNPKISDFGTAKLVAINQTHYDTSCAAGTYGYIAPEYAMRGEFSVKSDVFSFGVLLLEMLSGRNNSFSQQSATSRDLLGYTWRLWREGRTLELMDETLGESYEADEASRFIQTGLLCVQEDAHHRPHMSSVVVMLSSNSMYLPTPFAPPLFLDESTKE
ncbi:unnamed protein product [Victoria cruziana]